MKRFPYRIMVEWSERNECYIARVPALPNLGAHGSTSGEAADEAQLAGEAMIQELAFQGSPLPPPDLEKQIPLSDSSSSQFVAEGAGWSVDVTIKDHRTSQRARIGHALLKIVSRIVDPDGPPIRVSSSDRTGKGWIDE